MEPAPSTIRFACLCHVLLEVPIEQAGASIQCPNCGRLVDVPTLSDLQSLDEDGTYRMDELQLKDEPDRLQKLTRAFSREKKDEYGREIDLRESFHEEPPEEEEEQEELEEVDDAEIGEGEEILPAEIAPPDYDILAKDAFEPPPPPKYDPETGELLRPVPLQEEPVHFDPAVVPMAKAVINYAGIDVNADFRPWQIIPELFRFTNLFVMSLIFFTHVFMQLMMFPLMIGMWLVMPGFMFLCMALVAHYANVVNDIGYENRDELPRPLRDLSWVDDIWHPFVHGIVALMVCYGGMLFSDHFHGPGKWAFMGTIFILGTIGFPAVFLTTTCSGTVLNLMPDRLLRVINALGPAYLVAVVMFGISAVCYVAGIISTIMFLASLLVGSSGLPGWMMSLNALLGYGLLLLGIYLMHAFCWYLGLQYRQHNEHFNWLLQRHERTRDLIRPKYGFATLTGETALKARRGRPPRQAPPPPTAPQSHA